MTLPTLDPFCVHCRSRHVQREDDGWYFCNACFSYSREADIRAFDAFDEHLAGHIDQLQDHDEYPIERSGSGYWCNVCGSCVYVGEGPVL